MSTKLTRERIKEILLSVTPLLSRDEPEGWQALDELITHTKATIDLQAEHDLLKIAAEGLRKEASDYHAQMNSLKDALEHRTALQPVGMPSRGEIAMRLMAAEISYSGLYQQRPIFDATLALQYADALIAELNKPQP